MLRIRDFVRSGDTYLASVSYRREGPYDLVPRYRRDPEGERDGYRKLTEAVVRRLPDSEVEEVLRPEEAVLRGPAAEVADLLESEGVDQGRVGVTGSRLLGLETPESDLDMVIYGRDAFDAARDAATRLVGTGKLLTLSDPEWRRVYEKRSPELGYDEFVAHEKRKRNRFLIDGTLLDLLFVRSREEIDWGLRDLLDRNLDGEATVNGTVTDAEFGFDSPAVYEIDGDVSTVYSFTHTYAGQVFEGEELEARGYLVEGEDALLVGSTREAPGEYVRSIDL